MKLLRLPKIAKTTEFKARGMSSYNLSSKADSDIVDYTLETWGESQTHEHVTELLQFLQRLKFIAKLLSVQQTSSDLALPKTSISRLALIHSGDDLPEIRGYKNDIYKYVSSVNK